MRYHKIVVKKLIHGDAYRFNDAILKAEDMASRGECKIDFVEMDVNDLLIMTPHDASFAKELHLKSKSGFFNILTANKVQIGKGAMFKLGI